MPFLKFVLASVALLVTVASSSRSEAAYNSASCAPSPQAGKCLLDLVRSSRTAEELAGHMSSSHQKLVKDALETLGLSDPKDLDSRLELLLEDAVAAEAAEQNGALDKKYGAVCTAARPSGLTGHSGLLCSYSELKIAMTGNDPKAVTGAVDKLLKAIPGASSASPDKTVENLAKRAASSEEQMFAAAALADYGIAKKESDRATAVRVVDSAIEILLPFAEKSQIDLTTANHVATAAMAIAPQPWDADAQAIDGLPLVRRAARLSELAFGKDNSRIFAHLSQLQFHLWNSRFGAMKVEAKESGEIQKKGDSGDPLAELNKEDKKTSTDLLQENKALLRRLYSLALGEQDVSQQEQHLEVLATSAGAAEMESFVAELLASRARLVEQAVAKGKLPVSVMYESVLKVAENNLRSEEKGAAGLATINDVSGKLAKLQDNAKQLPRALLSEVHARATAVQSGKSPLRVQLPKAEAALKRAGSIIKASRSDTGADEADISQAENEIKDMKEKK